MSFFDKFKNFGKKAQDKLPDNMDSVSEVKDGVVNMAENAGQSVADVVNTAAEEVKKFTPDAVDNVIEKGQDMLGANDGQDNQTPPAPQV